MTFFGENPYITPTDLIKASLTITLLTPNFRHDSVQRVVSLLVDLGPADVDRQGVLTLDVKYPL